MEHLDTLSLVSAAFTWPCLLKTPLELLPISKASGGGWVNESDYARSICPFVAHLSFHLPHYLLPKTFPKSPDVSLIPIHNRLALFNIKLCSSQRQLS